MLKRTVFIFSLLAALAFAAQAQELSPTAAWAATLRYRVVPNVTYLTANGYEAKLDVYQPLNAVASTATGNTPVVVFIHGGGWTGGTKEASVLNILPYLDMNFAVVNVEYRLAKVSLAPAAVEDCRCALRWVIRNAKEYRFDTDKIIVTGHSAGGHLALTTGMVPDSAGLDRECFGPEQLKVAAIVNWYGITDVNDLLEGANQKTYAVQWLSSLPDREAVAKRVSPLQYVRAGLPPILTIHGDVDPTVPYTHATRLKAALDKAGVANELLTIPGGKHGGFTQEQYLKSYATIRAFLTKHGLLK